MSKDFNKPFKPGDRIALAAKFLRDTGQHTGSAPMRRGTYVGADRAMPLIYARIRWDDFESHVGSSVGQYSDLEWVEDCRANGQMIHAGNIAKVGSARFAANDLPA